MRLKDLVLLLSETVDSRCKLKTNIFMLWFDRECQVRYIKGFILLPEKFLQFHWLRADVFQLNLKYLHVKITVTMVTQNHQIISSQELHKNGGKSSRFWNRGDSRTKRKFGKPKYWEKYIDLAQCLDQLGRKQELQNQFARRRSETTRQK